MQRYFIGLDVDSKTKLSIYNWREKYLNGLPDRIIPAENYHITLSFLGHISSKQYELLVSRLQEIECSAFSAEITHIGTFLKPQILYLGLKLNEPFSALAEHCRQTNRLLGLKQPHTEFTPHISLTRKHKAAVPIAFEAPNLTLQFEKFHLFESVSSSEKGRSPHYPIRETFDLVPTFDQKNRA